MEKRIFVGHPIDVATGNVFTVANDFIFHSPLPLVWQRQYNTDKLEESPLGIGWQTEFFSTLKKMDNWIIFTNEEGTEIIFDIPSVGKSSYNPRAQMELINEENFIIIWFWHHKKKFYFEKQSNDHFILTKISNHLGHATELKYTAGLLTDLIDCVKRHLKVRYNQQGYIESIWLLLEDQNIKQLNLIRYIYDKFGNLITSYDPDNHARRYEYDSKHFLIKETNRLGGSFYFEYDKEKRCVHNWGDGGFQDRRLIYNEDNLTTTVLDSQERKIIYQQNEFGQTLTIINSVGGKTQKIFNVLGQLSMEIDPLGGITAYDYDTIGHRISITFPNKGIQKWTYNKLHLEETMVMPTGAEWKWTYTESGGIKTVTDPEGGIWEYNWSEDGHVSEVVAPNGHRTFIKADLKWGWLETGDNISSTKLEFNIFGYVSKIYDAEGLKRKYKHDSENRIIEIEEADGAIHKAVRDADGNLREIWTPNGGVQKFRLDLFGNVTERIDPIGSITKWKYDTEGNVIEIINQKGENLKYSYGNDGYINQIKYLDGRVENITRDLLGKIIEIITADNKNQYKWNNMGQVIERILSNGKKETFEYDLIGHLLQAKNETSNVLFTYDKLGRIQSDCQNNYKINYQRDSVGNFVSQDFSSSQIGPINFKYDLRGRLLSIENANNTIQKFDYDDLDRIHKRTFAESVTEKFKYNKSRRISTQKIMKDQKTIVEREYEYDTLDNITTISDNIRGNSQFQYDLNEQLIKEIHSIRGTSEFNYDTCGNLLSEPDNTYIYGDGNRLISKGNRKYYYNSYGNVSKIMDDSQLTHLSYDGANRLSEIIHPNGKSTKYQYDALGRRISKISEGIKTEFIWAGDDLAAEVENDGKIREYVMFEFQPYAINENQEWYLTIHDSTFTPQEFIDKDGNISWQGSFDAKNRLLKEEKNKVKNSLRSAGRYSDQESGLYYNRFRYFDPLVVRYISVDPIHGDRGRLNAYWAGPNLVNWIDPLGLDCGKPACGEIGVDIDGGYTDPQGRYHENGLPSRQKSIVLDSGESRNFPARTRRSVNQIGDRHGCHECHTMDPGTTPGRRPAGTGSEIKKGNWIVDHDPPVSQGGLLTGLDRIV